MPPLLLVLYVGMSLFPFAVGAGLHQWLMGTTDSSRGFGAVLVLILGLLCAALYTLVLHAIGHWHRERHHSEPTLRNLSRSDRFAVVVWPVACAAGFALTWIASGVQ